MNLILYLVLFNFYAMNINYLISTYLIFKYVSVIIIV